MPVKRFAGLKLMLSAVSQVAEFTHSLISLCELMPQRSVQWQVFTCTHICCRLGRQSTGDAKKIQMQ